MNSGLNQELRFDQMNDFETNEISSADSYLTGQLRLKAPLRQLLGMLDRVSALGFLQQRTLDDQYLPVQLGACWAGLYFMSSLIALATALLWL
jgi:predicted component of type VI protein secretion system